MTLGFLELSPDCRLVLNGLFRMTNQQVASVHQDSRVMESTLAMVPHHFFVVLTNKYHETYRDDWLMPFFGGPC